MFYNVENLFDPFNDTLTNDDEFLPQGIRNWSWERYRKKCIAIGKVIVAVGGEEAPELVGLCEVENRFVLEGIVRYGPLVKLGYEIVHRDSPDHRGIDVALLYQPERFRLLSHHFFPVYYKNQTQSKTREILYAKGITMTEDTLHVFVNHWPSRWGGQLESEHKRLAAATTLRSRLDSLWQRNSDSQIIVMGDFNDYPQNTSLSKVLNAGRPILNSGRKLYNLAMDWDYGGSHKYQGHWGMLDQILVTHSILKGKGILQCEASDFHVFQAPYLLEEDPTYLGRKPFRTYFGYKYQGGFSDHLPVYLDLWRK
jgi:hypothetical protein